MAYRLKWEHAHGHAECHEGWVEQETPERWWTAYMNYIDKEGMPDSRELGTFPTKREAKDRVEQEFAQFAGPPCRVLMKDGHPVVETSVVRLSLPRAILEKKSGAKNRNNRCAFWVVTSQELSGGTLKRTTFH